MFLLKNGELYNPDYMGVADILILNNKIAAIGRNIEINCTELDIKIRDLNHMRVAPGFIDNHVHIIGGGGEAGFHSRTPEVTLSSIIKHGVTTVVGVLGTDGTTRHLESLLAKAKALRHEGISAYIYTGSYELPIISITGSVRRDIMLIQEIIGVGEIAVSDHRSSVPTVKELARIASEARLGGMLSGKAGVVNLHMGSGKDGLDSIFKILKDTDIPIKHFLPTHVTRCNSLFEQAKVFAASGGVIDMTAALDDLADSSGIKVVDAVSSCLENGIPIERITISSDGNGSMPVFDPTGNIKGLQVAKLSSLLKELKALLANGLDLSSALKPFTLNVANVLDLSCKGRLAVGCDADINIFNDNMDIDTVIANGQIMFDSGRVIILGTFE